MSGRMRQRLLGGWTFRIRPRRAPCAFLVGVDRGLLFHRQADVVEAVDQAVLAERIDLEFDLAAVGAADFLVRQVDGQRRIGAALGVVEQLVEVFLARRGSAECRS